MKTYEVIHGDSKEEIYTVIAKHPKAIIVTDPPFNVGYHYNEYTDKLDEEDYYDMLKDIFSTAPFVVIHYPEDIYKIAFAVGEFPDKVVSWVYNSNTPKQHRDIAFFGIKPDFTKYPQPYKNPEDPRIAKRISEGKTARLYDWWEINQVKNVSSVKTEHPCQMPDEVMRRIIRILPEDAVIVDPFMGSGSTGLAALEADRHFVGIDIDEKYVELARKRLEAASQNVPMFQVDE